MEKHGLIYNFGDINDLEKKLKIVENEKYVNTMKEQCLLEARKYQRENAIKSLVEEL